MNCPHHHGYTAIVAALALTLTACGKSPEQHFQQAQELMQKADNKAAVIELKSVLQEQPNNREARLLLGKIYLASDAYSEAEKELTKARELGAGDDQVLPAQAQALLKRGQAQKVLQLAVPASGMSPQSTASFQVTRAGAFMGLGKRAEAEQALQIASQADSQYPELLLFRARLALIDQKKLEALQLVDAALQKDAKLVDALYLKAALLHQDKKDGEAAQVYRQIIANDAKQFRAHLAISQIQINAGKTEEAEKSLQAAEKAAGNAPMVRYARGTFELKRGKLDKASGALLDALRAMPDHLPTSLAYAMASYGLGNYEQSMKSAGKVLGAVPDNLIAAKILAGSQLKIGDVKGALKTLDPFLSKHANDAKLLALAGEAYLQSKDYNKAMNYLDKAAELDPENAMIKTRQAAGHLATGDSNEALADLEKAASLSDKPGQADLALVVLHLQRKQFDAALQAIAAFEKKLPNNPLTHNLRAAALVGKQDITGARKELETALAIQPTFVPAAMGLARLDLQDKNLPAARKRFESILAKDQNNLQAMLALADLAKADKQEGEYLKWLEKAVKTHPEAIPPSEYLVRYYLAKKDKVKALEIARQAVRANPENAQALSLLGSVQAATGAGAESIASFNTLVEKNKNSPQAYFQLAIAQLADKQPGPARTNLTRALQLKPDYITAQDALIRLELSEKKPEAALQIARQMQQQNPKSPLGFDREADIHLFQKSYTQALKAYEQALAKGASTQRFIKLHRVLMLSGDTKGGEKRLNAWLSQYPKDMTTRNYAAVIYLNAGRNREAIAQYETILKTMPNSALALNNLADLYQKEKDARALATAEQALKLAPDHPGIMDTLGWILLDQGQLPRATTLLRKAVDKAPKAGVLRYHLAIALSKGGDKANAKKELEAAIATGQKFPELESAKALLKSL